MISVRQIILKWRGARNKTFKKNLLIMWTFVTSFHTVYMPRPLPNGTHSRENLKNIQQELNTVGGDLSNFKCQKLFLEIYTFLILDQVAKEISK